MCGLRFAAKTTKLSVDGSVPVSRFARVLPDSNDYLRRWAKHLKAPKILQLMRKLGYQGPKHLLSMHACLLGDSRIRKYDIKKLKNRKLMAAMRSQYLKSKNSYGHLGTF